MSQNLIFHQNGGLVSPGTVRKLRPDQIQIALTCDSGELQQAVKAQVEALNALNAMARETRTFFIVGGGFRKVWIMLTQMIQTLTF